MPTGFRRIIGIESVATLHEEAEQNIARFRPRRGVSRHLSSVHALAQTVSLDAEPRWLFFVNPFPREVMREVLSKVGASLARSPRRLWLVLLFPELADVVAGTPGLQLACATKRSSFYRSDVSESPE